MQTHLFYKNLNKVFEEYWCDYSEELCEPYEANVRRPGVSPWYYFRLILIGLYEGLESQHGIAWRCNDSLTHFEILGLDVTEPALANASMAIKLQRLPKKVDGELFRVVF